MINLVGVLALFTNALVNHSWPFVILNAVWSATAIFALIQLAAKKRRNEPQEPSTV